MNAISAKEQINKQIELVIRTLLDTTDLSVKQIAERLHYEDPSYLCRIFRKQTGMTPMQYRNKLKI
jgi:AraC-like DNA-binding protein